MKPSSTLLRLALLCLFVSCHHDSFIDPSIYINADVQGRVLDDHDAPLDNAKVIVGGVNTYTNMNGEFKVNNPYVYKNGVAIKVTKLGFFTGIRTLNPTLNSKNNLEIKLIRKKPVGNFAGSAGGSVNVPTGGTIAFPANSLLNATSNTSYNNNVIVSAYFIDPTGNDFAKILPGDLRGIDANNNEVGLQSLGMMAVELNGSNGEKLQLAPGKKATITFPIPQLLIQQAQATIPLWYLDENDGIWKEEGIANKQGNNFVGQVSHFSTWNCDYPYPVIQFSATIQNMQGAPISRMSIDVIAPNGSTHGQTGDDGKVMGMIPANQPLNIIFNGTCISDKFKTGPFSSSHDFGVIHTKARNADVSLTITGTVKNCKGNAVSSGYVDLYLDGLYYRTEIAKGDFTFDVMRCSNSPQRAQITAHDPASFRESENLSITTTSGIVNTGNVTACTSPPEFININLDGVPMQLLPPYDSIYSIVLMGSRTQVNALRTDSLFLPNHFFDLRFVANGSGISQVDYLKFDMGYDTYVKANGTDMNVVITEFGSVNHFVAGTFSGYARNSTTHTDIPINGEFKVRRKF